MKRNLFLAVSCPMSGTVKSFNKCKKCSFNEYESITEYTIECSYREFLNNTRKQLEESYDNPLTESVFEDDDDDL